MSTHNVRFSCQNENNSNSSWLKKIAISLAIVGGNIFSHWRCNNLNKNVQAGLNLCWGHISEDIFSDIAPQMDHFKKIVQWVMFTKTMK